jgi:L,D-transpeptidase YbiS
VVSRVERPGRPRWQVATLGLSIGAAVPLLLAFIAAYLGGYSYQSLSSVGPPADLRLQPKQGVPQLEKRLAGSAPKGFYVVVDTAGNRLYLRKGEETVREAVCSTGTGGVLTDPKSGKQWVFETPFGLRKIQTKVKNPVWVKPEWAFVEEGKSMKDAPASERFDKAALGDYAMDIGNGYKIHGTLYTRMLGKSVTHGCIRLGDEDLLAVYNAVQVGTPVYLY